MYYDSILNFIKTIYKTNDYIPLHEPKFQGNEKKYLNECIDSGFVSSVGKFVDRFELDIANFCGVKYAVATTNGTSALHLSLHALNVDENCEVITQPLSFIATSNAIAYTGAKPVYIDVDIDSMGMSPFALENFLNANAQMKDGYTINKKTKKVIKACVPMHTFGHPVRIIEIKELCQKWNIHLIEDAAESLGSYALYNNDFIHTGNFGVCGILSFNGNKTITCGGGGAILTNDEILAKKLKHLSTTAKLPHIYKYEHDSIAYNYRLPNINAALAVAQIEQLEKILSIKMELSKSYENFFEQNNFPVKFIKARSGTKPNFWLNAIMFENTKDKDLFLEYSNKNGIMTRPVWVLSNELKIYKDCQCGDLTNAKFLSERIVNIPSSVNQ
ncbi:LegC family aminotransferase [Campylobacter lari]|uniref:LegC family aminotransferase n=1 Tax=Campylobacter lari TaxID=201 RepID=UPI00057EF702|nr:LegC family aminotransferase [Campylobacter lari]AJC88744.1 aminotransferase, DegT/DnrJ/EryC1/StrS family [Campylobacter lari subsp. concheus LMG 11760]EAH7187494.1 LegC family aminotransferase [Campylobacter lari]EAK0437955.1 LegC family aminotransferase [Campylobacter lari]EAL3890412.1 LegC family aminotransferase [Campylobacter lari]EEA6125722.1 LegC family aminotransferase [Campylobacter lari]